MRFIDVNPGDKLNCITDYTDCIHAGNIYEVSERKSIQCDAGEHDLESTATDDGDLPEFEKL